MKDCIILDLDSTVADCDHRIHHIKDGRRDWDGFFEGIERDTPIEHTVRLAAAWAASGQIVVALTGRPEKYRSATEAWNAKHLPFPVAKLYMRDESDYRGAPVIKVAAIDKMRADGFNPIVAFDDHPGIVKAFREAGLPTYHVTDHGDDAPKKIWNGETFLTMLVGPAGSGKSTFAAGIPASWIISSDEVRELMTPWKRDDPSNEDTFKAITSAQHAGVWRAVHDMIVTRLSHGLPTVLDATNIHARDRKAILDVVPQGQNVRYVVLDRPLDQKLATAGWRNEALVRKMHESFKSGIKHALNGDGKINVSVVDLRLASAAELDRVGALISS